ncbi:hypothetical protein Fmac_017949 [Flemingia macrophylla]|uniref:Uncharacterized protein n=1 Tax=Flemingia macrophylla TaxID=520843 RepID=A0ABD1M3I6_9FABA
MEEHIKEVDSSRPLALHGRTLARLLMWRVQFPYISPSVSILTKSLQGKVEAERMHLGLLDIEVLSQTHPQSFGSDPWRSNKFGVGSSSQAMLEASMSLLFGSIPLCQELFVTLPLKIGFGVHLVHSPYTPIRHQILMDYAYFQTRDLDDKLYTEDSHQVRRNPSMQVRIRRQRCYTSPMTPNLSHKSGAPAPVYLAPAPRPASFGATEAKLSPQR